LTSYVKDFLNFSPQKKIKRNRNIKKKLSLNEKEENKMEVKKKENGMRSMSLQGDTTKRSWLMPWFLNLENHG